MEDEKAWGELRKLQDLLDVLGKGEITLVPVVFKIPPIIKFECQFEIGNNIYRGQRSDNIGDAVRYCMSVILEKLSG